MTEPDAPGERFKFVFDLPRREQIARLRVLIDALPLDMPDTELSERLADIEYDIHTIREAIWHDEVYAIRIRNAAQTVRKTERKLTLPTTLEDLI